MSEVKSSEARDPGGTGARRLKSDATRRKILRAADEEFSAHGYHGATMAAIAKRAGVASQTIYFVFHTKAALISAAIDSLVMGEATPTIPQETDWWRAMLEEPDPGVALRHFVSGAATLFERASRLSEILRAAALTDQEVRRTHDYHEQLRAAGFREVIEVIAQKGSLRPGLTIDSATEVLLVVFSDSTYVLFTSERGWSHDQTVRWFGESLPRLLLN
jgi:AcrR family transcriptional regulator